MKYLILTMAGSATRFNRDTAKETHKSLYYTDSPKYSLLSQLILNCGEYDKYIIVGGYLYDDLQEFVKEEFSNLIDKIELVLNEHYNDYGSGYSLYMGILSLSEPGEVTFVEGDLFFDKENFREVYNSKSNVITINKEPIVSNKSVILYLNKFDKPRYLYDIQHQLLKIKEPFKAVFNSAQIWKFNSSQRLKDVVLSMNKDKLYGTNLEIIQSYFGNLDCNDYEIICIDNWFNCNTVSDYNLVRKLM